MDESDSEDEVVRELDVFLCSAQQASDSSKVAHARMLRLRLIKHC